MEHVVQFKNGMRRLTAGVSIITTTDVDGTPLGFAATAVTSVSADPTPTLLVCVNRNVSCHDIIVERGMFCVNVLGEHSLSIAQVFSSSQDREKRFNDIQWKPLVTGAPALEDAIVSFDCRVVNALAVHSHTVFLGTVEGVALRDEPISPLLYAGGRFDALRSIAGI